MLKGQLQVIQVIRGPGLESEPPRPQFHWFKYFKTKTYVLALTLFCIFYERNFQTHKNIESINYISIKKENRGT